MQPEIIQDITTLYVACKGNIFSVAGPTEFIEPVRLWLAGKANLAEVFDVMQQIADRAGLLIQETFISTLTTADRLCFPQA